VAFYAKGKQVGKKISYSPDGKPTLEETYNDDGERIGIKNFDPDGRVIDNVNFPYGALSYTLHYQNGKVKSKRAVSDRKFNGIKENYFPNGQLKSKNSSIFGNQQGLSQEWDHLGKLVDSRNFSMNEMDGKWTEYKNGQLLTIDSYEMGANQGLFKEYHPNGRLFRAFMEEGGERQGNSDCYATDSTWMYGVQYLNDVAYAVSYFDNQGKLHANERIDDSKKEIVCYFKDGKVSARLPIAKGIFDGKHSIYYTNGKLEREINYVNDYREGQSKYYYENGILKELYNWKSGSMTGTFNSYFPNGQKEMEGNYISNKKTGKWLVYNQSGKLIETLSYADDELYEIK
jgi:antitoxin component YwqK of YwqJK toxin-antitoxin module